MSILSRMRFRRSFRIFGDKSSGITWVFHSRPGEICQACTIAHDHYDTCTCGHCPPKSSPIVHRRLSEVYADLMEGMT